MGRANNVVFDSVKQAHDREKAKLLGNIRASIERRRAEQPQVAPTAPVCQVIVLGGVLLGVAEGILPLLCVLCAGWR